jgi:hypothetical protein
MIPQTQTEAKCQRRDQRVERENDFHSPGEPPSRKTD